MKIDGQWQYLNDVEQPAQASRKKRLAEEAQAEEDRKAAERRARREALGLTSDDDELLDDPYLKKEDLREEMGFPPIKPSDLKPGESLIAAKRAAA